MDLESHPHMSKWPPTCLGRPLKTVAFWLFRRPLANYPSTTDRLTVDQLTTGHRPIAKWSESTFLVAIHWTYSGEWQCPAKLSIAHGKSIFLGKPKIFRQAWYAFQTPFGLPSMISKWPHPTCKPGFPLFVHEMASPHLGALQQRAQKREKQDERWRLISY